MFSWIFKAEQSSEVGLCLRSELGMGLGLGFSIKLIHTYKLFEVY